MPLQPDPKPATQTGHASNPEPGQGMEPETNQLIDEKGEKYLREVASIEDLPDAQDQEDMDKSLDEQEGG